MRKMNISVTWTSVPAEVVNPGVIVQVPVTDKSSAKNFVQVSTSRCNRFYFSACFFFCQCLNLCLSLARLSNLCSIFNVSFAVRWHKTFWKPSEIVTRYDIKPNTTSATAIVNVDTSSDITATTNIGKAKENHQHRAISLYWMIITGCLVLIVMTLLTISAMVWYWRKQLTAFCKSLLSKGEWSMCALQPYSSM